MKEIINKVLILVLAIILLMSSILINDSNEYYTYIQIMAYAIFGAYSIYKITKKEPLKIITNKLDICVIVLVISTLLPIIFNTYVSLKTTIQTILEYTFILVLYILIREILQKEKGANRIISNILIVTTVLTVLVGIDGITSNLLEGTLKSIGIGNFTNGENRLISFFGYANTVAAYIGSMMFLNINEYLNQENKKIKAIYKTITSIFLIGIILTYSKGVFLLLPIFLLLYIIKLKDKNRKLEVIENVIISIIIAIIYVGIFEKLNANILVWIMLAVSILINFLINLILEKTEILQKVLKIKHIGIIGIGAIIAFIVYILIGLNIYSEYKVFSSKNDSKYEAKIINNIKGSTEYLFEFDIKAKSPSDIKDAYKINLIERNQQNQELANTEIKFGTFEGKKEIKINTHKETSEIKIEFISRFKFADRELTVKKLYINGEKIALAYKLLPTKIVEKVKNIRINYKTAQERLAISNDALQLAKESKFIGIGGNGWRYKYQEVQDYNYQVNYIHSYPAKVILEFGIIGLIAYLGIVVIIIKQFIKSKDTNLLAILISILFMLAHSIIDTNMEVSHILVYIFMLLGVISKNIDKQVKIKGNLIINIIFIFIITVNIVLLTNARIYDRSRNIARLIKQENGLKVTSTEYKEINKKMAREYQIIENVERYDQILTYRKIIEHYIESDYENIDKILEEYYSKIVNYNSICLNDINHITSKIENVYKIIRDLGEKEDAKYNEIIQKFIDIILDEYDNTEKYMQQYYENNNVKKDERKNQTYLEEIYADMIILKREISHQDNIIVSTITEINKELLNKIDSSKKGEYKIYYINSNTIDWKEILAIYFVKNNKNSIEMSKITKEDKDKLRKVFWDITEVSSNIQENNSEKILNITVIKKSKEEIMQMYNFGYEQMKLVKEMLNEENTKKWKELIYGSTNGSSEIIKISQKQLGNIGGEKYWEWYGYPNKVPWCACFVSWCANRCGYIKEGIIPKFSNCQEEGISLFKALNLWKENEYTPKTGDIIFFDWENDNNADHVGIVEKVEKGKIYTIEGNSSGDICRKKEYEINDKVIIGYGTPLY